MNAVQGIAAPKCGQCKRRQCVRDKTAKSGFRSKCWYCGMSPESLEKHRTRRNAKLRGCAARKAKKWIRDLRDKYGLTPDEYDVMVAGQGGVCFICRQPEVRTRKGKLTRLCVDHCHRTGRVRSILCSKCNFAVGLVEDNPALLTQIAEYLVKHGPPNPSTR